MKTEERFFKDFTESHFYTNKVANWLSSKGIKAMISPYKLRPDVSERKNYADDGDIEIIMRVEVKHRTNVDFTSIEDYPYDTIIVDEAYKVKPYFHNLYCIAICSKDGKHMILIPKSTRSKWTEKVKYDPSSGRERTFYEVDKNLCHCINLEEEK